MKMLKRLFPLLLIIVAAGFAGSGAFDDFMPPSASDAKPGKAQAGDPKGCKRVDRVVVVELPASEYPNLADHMADAIADGHPRVLHIDRAGSEDNRDESLRGIETREGYDRDEWPVAMSREGGEGADVRLIPSSENRSAGSSMGAQLSDFCSGQAFRVATN